MMCGFQGQAVRSERKLFLEAGRMLCNSKTFGEIIANDNLEDRDIFHEFVALGKILENGMFSLQLCIGHDVTRKK